MYLDESGHSRLDNPRVREESDFFLLGGVIVKERDFVSCDKAFKDFKKKQFPGIISDIPVHAVELNHVSRSSKSKYKGILTDEDGKKILAESYKFIAKCPIEAIAVIIDNHELKKKYTQPRNPYVLSYPE